MGKWWEDSKLLGRFERKFIRVDPEACWLWTGGKLPKGYGLFWNGNQMVCAHRVALVIKLGRDLRPGEQARHRCDMPACVNPDHIVPGSAADNSKDMTDRERQMRGEEHVCAKLSENDVQEIREMFDQGLSNAQIAQAYPVHRRSISDIRTGKTWKHVRAAAQ